MKSCLYKNFYIMAMADDHGGFWAPYVWAMWLDDSKQERAVVPVSFHPLTTREAAEDYGLQVGRAWVDKRIQGKTMTMSSEPAERKESAEKIKWSAVWSPINLKTT